MVLRFVRYRLVFDHIFDSLYPFTLHKHTAANNDTIFFVIAIVMGEFNMLILQKYGFKVGAISFGF